MKKKYRRMQLDVLSEKLRGWASIGEEVLEPKGWIRAIRKSLAMPAWHLGKTMGVSTQRVLTLEKAEEEDRITLGSLKKAADALDCDLVYGLVPKGRSLKGILKKRAEWKARKILEDVNPGSVEYEKRVELLVRVFMEKPTGELWKD